MECEERRRREPRFGSMRDGILGGNIGEDVEGTIDCADCGFTNLLKVPFDPGTTECQNPNRGPHKLKR